MRIVYVVLALSITLLIFSVNVALWCVFEYGYKTASWKYDAMLYDQGVIKPPGFLPKRIEEPQPKPELREWSCKQLVTCEPADWIGIDGNGRAKPEDHCTYEYRIIKSVENPVNYPEYGAKCW